MNRYFNELKQAVKKLLTFFDMRSYINPILKKIIVNQFHALYYDSYQLNKTWIDTYWLGIWTMKCPFDLWIYQEMIYNLKPDLIIECGTAYGGSALYLASICSLLDKGKIISIDIKYTKGRPKHKRINYILGSSISEKTVSKVKQYIHNSDTVMVILDSDHHKEHVLKELSLYSSFVTKGSYIIVEDTNLNGHPIRKDYGPGPMEAVDDFLKDNNQFKIDKTKDKFYLTFSPNGYLKKIK